MSLVVKPVGKPDAGNLHVRFDERGWETGRRFALVLAPILDSTGRGVDAAWTAALHLAVLYRAVDEASGDRRNLSSRERIVDDPDCAESDRHSRGVANRQTVSDP